MHVRCDWHGNAVVDDWHGADGWFYVLDNSGHVGLLMADDC